MSYHIKIVASNAIIGNSLCSQNFGTRENIEALIPVGTRPLAVILFVVLGSYLFLQIWENILLKLGK